MTPNRFGLGGMKFGRRLVGQFGRVSGKSSFSYSVLDAATTDYHTDPGNGSMGRCVAWGHWYRRGPQEVGIASSACSSVRSPLFIRGSSVGNEVKGGP